MPPRDHHRLPEVSIVHFNVGPDRSITVKQFLRAIKRDSNSSCLHRRAQDQERLELREPKEPQGQAQHPPEETALPAFDDGVSADYLVPDTYEEVSVNCRTSSPNGGLQPRPKGPPSPATSSHPKIRKVYKRKHIDFTPALYASDLTLPSSLRGSTIEGSQNSTFTCLISSE